MVRTLVTWFAVAGCGADDSANDTDATPTGTDRSACEAYIDCVAEVEPANAGQAVDDYGAESSCWTNADQAEACREACASAMAELHLAAPSSEACDDGSSVPSNQVFLIESWRLNVVTSDAEYCAYMVAGMDPDYWVATFAANETTQFPAQLRAEYVGAGFDLACTNDGLNVHCASTDTTGGGMSATFEGAMAESRQSLTGTVSVEFRSTTCTWEVES
jgi:hypothetical protein